MTTQPAPSAEASPRRLLLATLGVTVLAVLLLLTRSFLGARAEGQLTACKSNLKNIGTACEMYSTDYEGRYPPRISLLVPKYLKSIPTCPAAERDTYTESFQSTSSPDVYTFYCSGENHAWAEDDR